MTFAEVVQESAEHRGLLQAYDRINGTNLSMRGKPIDLLIDESTGRMQAEVPGFVAFVYRAIWLPLIAQERGSDPPPGA